MLNVKCALCVNKKWIGFTLSQREIASPIEQAELTSLKKCWIFFTKWEELKKNGINLCGTNFSYFFYNDILTKSGELNLLRQWKMRAKRT